MTLVASYTTVGRVLAHYPPIGSVTTITSSHIAETIGATQAEINGRLAGRYTVPFGAVPPLIEAITLDLSVHSLLSKRIFTQDRPNATTWLTAWARSFETLDQLAAGSIPLVSGSGTSMPAATGELTVGGIVWSNTMANTPTMNEGPWVDMTNEDA